MESISSGSRAQKMSRADKEKDGHHGNKDKAGAHDEKSSKTPRSTRYKDKFNTLREKYEQVMAVQHAHQRDLDAANAKMKKLQEEIDLLLEAMIEAAAQHPHAFNFAPAPIPGSGYVERPVEREQRGSGSVDVEMKRERDPIPIPIQPAPHGPSSRRDNSLSRPAQGHEYVNGRTNGSNGIRHFSREPDQELNQNYLPREGSGRISIS